MNLNPLTGGIGIEGIITFFAAVAAFITVYAVWAALLAGNPLSRRAKILGRHRRELRDDMLAPRRSRHRHKQTVGLMHKMAARLNLLKSRQAEKTALHLARAGWRSKDALVIYLSMKVLLPFAFGGGAVLFIYAMDLAPWPPMVRLLAALVVVLVGAYMPEIYVKNAAQKRARELAKGLPDTLDLLVICAEAGLGLDAALTRVAREMEHSFPEIADEFGLTAIELGFLPERRMALENLSRRTNLPAVRGVVNTLAQTEKYGTPLAQSLRVLAAEFRGERMMKAEEKAAKLPAILTIPLVMFVLPTLFVVLLGPAILRAIDGLGGL